MEQLWQEFFKKTFPSATEINPLMQKENGTKELFDSKLVAFQQI